MFDTSGKSPVYPSMSNASNAIDEILDSGLQPTDKIRHLITLLNRNDDAIDVAAFKIVMVHERYFVAEKEKL